MSTNALTVEQREDLVEFVAQVGQLKSSKFGQRVLSQPTLTMRSTGGSNLVEIVNFDEDEFRSFLLGCRMLIQNNERISAFNIWTIFKDTIKDFDWFARVNPPRWTLNEYLDQEMILSEPTGEVKTNRQLVDTFLYGAYAHLNRDHQRRFRVWKALPQFHSLKLLFLLGLQELLKTTVEMASVVEDYLSQNKT